MKRLLTLCLCSMFCGALALAADTENNTTDETSHSHNPITGSDTKTTTHKTKKKDARGKHMKKKKMKTTKKTNGGTDTSTTTEESNTPAD